MSVRFLVHLYLFEQYLFCKEDIPPIVIKVWNSMQSKQAFATYTNPVFAFATYTNPLFQYPLKIMLLDVWRAPHSMCI